MKWYDIYRECETLELVRMIQAESLNDAKARAFMMGYDLEHYRVEESWED